MRVKAIYNTHKNVVSVNGEHTAYDKDGKTVTLNESLIRVEIGRLQKQYRDTEYQRLRAAEYPDIKEYLDGIVKGDEAQVQEYIDACLAVKAKYPKPEGV